MSSVFQLGILYVFNYFLLSWYHDEKLNADLNFYRVKAKLENMEISSWPSLIESNERNSYVNKEGQRGKRCETKYYTKNKDWTTWTQINTKSGLWNGKLFLLH